MEFHHTTSPLLVVEVVLEVAVLEVALVLLLHPLFLVLIDRLAVQLSRALRFRPQ
jgi:hypothetical protein